MKKTLLAGFALTLIAACGNGDNNDNANTNGATNGATNGMTNGTPNGMTNGATNGSTNGSTNNGTTVPCDDVTFEGACLDATTFEYCDDTLGLVEVDCTENFGATSTCIDIDGYGADCAVAAGEACEVEDGEDSYFLFCSGTAPACVFSAFEDVSCQENFPVASCDFETFEPSCSGDFLLVDCNETQPLAIDCTGFNGTCDATNVHCVMPAGEACDDDVFMCDAGLTCNIADGEFVGTCE